jgi:cyanophycinase
VPATTILTGSLDALARAVDDGLLEVGHDADLVVVPTAAAFTGMTEAAVALAASVEGAGATVEALMIGDRAAATEPYFARRLREADAVVLGDGAALHAKSVWHGTPVGEALRDARRLVAVGTVASLLGDLMIDPRGGAPTVGLGYRTGLVVTLAASEEQLARTRALLDPAVTLAVLGPWGVVYFDESRWRRWGEDVAVTRGDEAVEL